MCIYVNTSSAALYSSGGAAAHKLEQFRETVVHCDTGAVELREDVPLQGGGEARPGCAGPRLIAAAFAALSAAVTLALLTQIYYGDYEVVPHGSVSASVPACSAGGARLLRAGGGALDAAAAAALCLAAAAPHRLAALDASGSLLYWDYRRQHEAAPTLAEWGAAGAVGAGGAAARAWDAQPTRPPRLLAALAALHAQLGRLPWSRLLQPAIDYAESLATDEPAATTDAAGAAPGGGAAPGAAVVAQLLRSVQYNSSRDLCAAWRCAALLRAGPAPPLPGGGWRVYSGAAAAPALLAALAPRTHRTHRTPDSVGVAAGGAVGEAAGGAVGVAAGGAVGEAAGVRIAACRLSSMMPAMRGCLLLPAAKCCCPLLSAAVSCVLETDHCVHLYVDE
ncbi:Gamma-glutamyltransferase 7 [Papilio xuthus]|uniref:Gamma-glutamyltransferase 7 n=1 Tax=Papilio xuthus TaxID=66420 RepID=A0A194QGX4_PAPXU|nr:Gamma-glutamyltransferase 7 [Papilio xuthus]